jgi:hypothetical protein
VKRGYGLMMALAGLVVLGLPPVRNGLESSLIGHMVIQLPMLILCGWILGQALGPIRKQEGACNRYGLTGLLLALFTLAFWLLPRSLDSALLEPAYETAKFVTLPLLAGVPLSRSWPRLPAVFRWFLLANIIPMLVVMGWLYEQSPVRLCNNYMMDQQLLLARALWAIAGALALLWILRAFTVRPEAVQDTKED